MEDRYNQERDPDEMRENTEKEPQTREEVKVRAEEPYRKRVRCTLKMAAKQATNTPPALEESAVDAMLPKVCWPQWRSAKNQGAQSTKSGLRSEFLGHCVLGQHVEPWVMGLVNPPAWVHRPKAAARVIKIRKEMAIELAMVGYETLLEMEEEYEAGSESILEVVEGTLVKLEGLSAAKDKMAKVKNYINSRIDIEHQEETAVLLKRMSRLPICALNDEQILSPAKAFRDVNNNKATAKAQTNTADKTAKEEMEHASFKKLDTHGGTFRRGYRSQPY